VVRLGAYYQGHSSLSKAEIEIATNLTNAKWLAGYSNYEHEIIAERDGGLPPEKVEALIVACTPRLKIPRSGFDTLSCFTCQLRSRRPPTLRKSESRASSIARECPQMRLYRVNASMPP
jgi:hypothetical protein